MAIDALGWARIRRLINHFLGAAGAQAIVQALGLVSSILIIRLTSPAEFALYTLGLSLQGALAATADAGIAANVMAQGGRVAQDRAALGSVLAAGEHLRVRLALILVVLVLPFGYCIIQRSYPGTWSAAAIMLAVLLSFVAHLPAALLEVPMKLHQDFRRLFRLRIGLALARVSSLVAVTFAQPVAWVLIAATGLTQAAFNPLQRAMASRYIDKNAVPSAASLLELRGVVKRSLPGAIYYSVQSQVSVWLLAAFGVAQSVADLGALGRLAAITTLVTVAFDTVIVPKFAQLHKAAFFSALQRVMTAAAILLSVVAYVFILATVPILSLLGENYAHLKVEFSLLCGTTVVWLLATFTWSINNARAHVPPWFVYPMSGIVLFLVSSLIFGIETPLAAIRTQLVMGLGALFTNTAVAIVYGRRRK